MPKAKVKKRRGPGRPFPKGVSGNPLGRKKKAEDTGVLPSPLGGDGSIAKVLRLIDRLLSPGVKESMRPWEVRNIEQRRRILGELRNRPDWQEWVIRACRQRGGVVLFINLFGWQFNPKKKGLARVGPFVLWDFQRRALLDTPETTGRKGILWCVENDRGAVVEKARELGATWLFLFLQDHLAIFHEYTQIGNISKSEAAVDCKSPDSLFWKLRFIHEHLPQWLTGPITSLKKFFGFERSQSSITGEASTGKSFSGGRASIIFVDEAAKIDELKQLRESLASVSDCVFYNSTHLGTATEFHRLTQTPEIVKIQMHWSRHPDKNEGLYSYDLDSHKLRFWKYVPGDGLVEIPGPTHPYPHDFDFVLDGSPTGGPFPGLRSPWYDRKAREIGTARAVAQELDIDPRGSASKPFDPLLIHQLKQFCKPPSWEGDLEYTPDGMPIKLVPVVGGPIKLWCPVVNGRPPKSSYGAGCDISAGTGNSPSTLSIVNARTGEKVLRYSNAHIRPDQFGILVAAICRLFCDEHGSGAKTAWEHVGGPGVLFGNTLMNEAGYRNVYYTTDETRNKAVTVKTASPGWRPMGSNKNILLTAYILALTNREILNYDEEALEDCLAFKYDATGKMVHSKDATSDPEAARENHGDDVIADALACKMVIEGGQLASRLKELALEIPPEDNFLTVAGRRALRQRREREEQWA